MTVLASKWTPLVTALLSQCTLLVSVVLQQLVVFKRHRAGDSFGLKVHPSGDSFGFWLQNTPWWWQFWLQNCTNLVTICLQHTLLVLVVLKTHLPGDSFGLTMHRAGDNCPQDCTLLVQFCLYTNHQVMSEGYKSKQSELAGFIFHIIVIQFLAYSCLYTSTWQNILSHPCPSDNEFPWQVTSFHIKRC